MSVDLKISQVPLFLRKQRLLRVVVCNRTAVEAETPRRFTSSRSLRMVQAFVDATISYIGVEPVQPAVSIFFSIKIASIVFSTLPVNSLNPGTRFRHRDI